MCVSVCVCTAHRKTIVLKSFALSFSLPHTRCSMCLVHSYLLCTHSSCALVRSLDGSLASVLEEAFLLFYVEYTWIEWTALTVCLRKSMCETINDCLCLRASRITTKCTNFMSVTVFQRGFKFYGKKFSPLIWNKSFRKLWAKCYVEF